MTPVDELRSVVNEVKTAAVHTPGTIEKLLAAAEKALAHIGRAAEVAAGLEPADKYEPKMFTDAEPAPVPSAEEQLAHVEKAAEPAPAEVAAAVEAAPAEVATAATAEPAAATEAAPAE